MFWRRGLWQDFALLVMLCSWMAIGAPQKEPYEILDFFSGRGRIATLASRAGFACAATDMAVDKDKRGQRCRLKASRSFRSVMDWNGDSGFASFGGTSPRASVQPRLVVLLCLRATYGGTLMSFGTVCSTWVTVNRGTSERSSFLPMGNPLLLANRKANKMVTRTA